MEKYVKKWDAKINAVIDCDIVSEFRFRLSFGIKEVHVIYWPGKNFSHMYGLQNDVFLDKFTVELYLRKLQESFGKHGEFLVTIGNVDPEGRRVGQYAEYCFMPTNRGGD